MTERYCLVEPYDPRGLAMRSQRLYTTRLFPYRDERQRNRDERRERAALGLGGPDEGEARGEGGEEAGSGGMEVQAAPVQFAVRQAAEEQEQLRTLSAAAGGGEEGSGSAPPRVGRAAAMRAEAEKRAAAKKGWGRW